MHFRSFFQHRRDRIVSVAFSSPFSRALSVGLGAVAIATPLTLSSISFASAKLMTPAKTTASAQTKSTLSELPSEKRAALIRGEVLVEGSNGEFFGQVLVNASIETAWDVLTDYDNFEKFLPNITNSELISSEGNRNIFKQDNEFKVLPFVTTKSSIEVQATETQPNQVEFTLVDGDLESLDGVWLLEPIATAEGDRVLVTHQVSVDPGNASPRGIFYSTYKSMLEDSLAAAKREAESRSAAL